MKKRLLRALSLASFASSFALAAVPAYAGWCQVCQKREDAATVERPAHANTCVSGGACNGCKYYFRPEYDCPFKLNSDCDISTSAHIAATVYEVGCNQGCACPARGGLAQAATFDSPGETCV